MGIPVAGDLGRNPLEPYTEAKMRIMQKEKCGYRDMHWYQSGETCVCGQIPKEIFFSAGCSCGAYRYRKPVHDPDCSQIQWAKKRNRWISEHPDINPPLDRVCYKVKEVFIEGQSEQEVATEIRRQQCIANIKSVAPMELYQKIADFGNEKLGHIWGFTVDDILRVMEAVILYCKNLKRNSSKIYCGEHLAGAS